MKQQIVRTLGAMIVIIAALGTASARDELVARMGANELTAAQFSRLVEDGLVGQMQRTDVQAVERTARAELIRRAVIEEARKQGWDRKPEVQERMGRASEQALLASYMNDLARPPANYPSDKELREAYEASRTQLMAPRQYHLAQVYVSFQGGKAEKEAERGINDIWREARRKNSDFGALARQYSEHKPSGEQGGDMGWLPENGILPEVREAAAGLGRNEISKPVKTAQGYHLLKLLDRKEAAVRPFEEVRAALVQALRLQRAREIEAAYLDSLLARNPITVNRASLNSLASGSKPK